MDCFTASSSPVLHVSQVRKWTGLPPMTCAGILRSLVAERLLERNGDTYQAGLRVVSRWTELTGRAGVHAWQRDGGHRLARPTQLSDRGRRRTTARSDRRGCRG